VALRRIIRATDLHSKHLSRDFGLTTPQAYVLQAIRDLGEVTTGQVSRCVNLSQATVTTILDRLEGRGLIERYRSLADRRVVHASLTKQGRRILRKAPPLLQERFVATFASLKPSDQERIVETLEAVADMMGAGELDAAPLLAVGSPVNDDDTLDAQKDPASRKRRGRAASSRIVANGDEACAD
jgi:DNA-binding MarR family transcriptional regulator